jgi:Xaa-Pro aminopeptidase
MNSRITALQKRLVDSRVDLALISRREHFYYFTGYRSYYGGAVYLLIPKDGAPVAVVPEGEKDSLASVNDGECRSYSTFSMEEPIDNVAKALHAVRETVSSLVSNLRSLGLEKDYLPMSFGSELAARLGKPSQIDISVILSELRRVKDGEEISKLRESVRVATLGLKKGLELVKPGIREIDILAQAKAAMESEVAEPIEVFADVISGSKTLKIGAPAVYAQNRVVKKGEFVIMDILPRVAWYWADLTRTGVAGSPTRAQADLYELVAQANAAALRKVRPGARALEMDRAARKVLVEGGCSETYPHHTGHGLGLDMIEAPSLLPHNGTPLVPGMVITIEPGVYDKKLGGVRIGVDVLVTETGAEILENLPKEIS